MKLEPLLPWWALLLLLVPAATWLAWYTSRSWRGGKSTPKVALCRLWGIMVCLVAIGLGPSMQGDMAPAGMVNLDVVIAVDRTTSISAEDYNGTHPRLEGIKHDLLALIERLKGARIALITFDSSARIVVPFTSDSSAASMAVTILDPEVSTSSQGSTIDLPLELATKLLSTSKQAHPDRGRLFFYIGDGEQTAEAAPRSFGSLQPLVSGGAVLGYGTVNGGKMKSYYGVSDETYTPLYPYVLDYSKHDAQYNYLPAISVIQEQNLKNIANAVGVGYVHRTSPSETLDTIVDASRLQVIADTHREILHYVSLYWVFSFIIAFLVAWWALSLVKVFRVALRREGSV